MTIIAATILILFAISLAVFFLMKKLERMLLSKDEKEESAFVTEIRSQIDQRLEQSSSQINERLSEAAKYMMELNRTNVELSRSMGQFHELGKSMKDFQDLFSSQKSRGIVGEQVLAEVLRLVLPDNLYELQHKFNDGSRVDAVIKLEVGMVPVDSKFPLENFRLMNKADTEAERNAAKREFAKDVKNHIDAIAKKYILSHEGTVDYALMYVPMESVYNTISEDAGLTGYAQTKRIWAVSPNNFYQIIQMVMTMYQHTRANDLAKKALQAIGGVQQEAGRFEVELTKLTTHINNAKNMSDSVNNRFQKLSAKLENATVLELEETKVLSEHAETELAPERITTEGPE